MQLLPICRWGPTSGTAVYRPNLQLGFYRPGCLVINRRSTDRQGVIADSARRPIPKLVTNLSPPNTTHSTRNTPAPSLTTNLMPSAQGAYALQGVTRAQAGRGGARQKE